ncbi:MAG: hypothetical protein ACAH80_07555 [Alphaproteobacteria bacterium]
MRFAAVTLALLLAFFTTGAQACSHTADYANRTMQQKMDEADVTFIGTVTETGDGYVIFRIGTPGKGAAVKGETMRLAHKEYGTCGKLDFKVGDVWLYAGDTTFSASQKIDAADAEAEIPAVIAKITAAE